VKSNRGDLLCQVYNLASVPGENGPKCVVLTDNASLCHPPPQEAPGLTEHPPLRPTQGVGNSSRQLLLSEPRAASGFVEGAAEQA
jgi:hypothetical protein